MSARGKKSNFTIAGHTLTWAELTVLGQLADYLRIYAADGRSVPLQSVFPGDHSGQNAKRYCARRLAEFGVLQARQIELTDDMVKSVPR
jgi:hypothetical protein